MQNFNQLGLSEESLKILKGLNFETPDIELRRELGLTFAVKSQR